MSPLLFKLHITQLYCRKEKEKFEKNKFLAAQKPGKQFFDAKKCHVINFFGLLFSAFESKNKNLNWYDFGQL